MKKSLFILSMMAFGAAAANAAYTVVTDSEMYTNPAAWLYVWTGNGSDTNWDTDGNWNYYTGTDDSEPTASGKPVNSDPGFIGYDFAMVDGQQVLTANDDVITVGMSAWPSLYIYLGTNVTLTGSNNGFNAGTNIDFATFSGTSTITMGAFWKRGDVNFYGDITMEADTFEYVMFTSTDLQQDSGTWNGAGVNVTDAKGNVLTYSETVTDEAGYYYVEKVSENGLTSITLHATAVAVPEPATASLSLLGLAALMMRRRRA